MTITLEIVSVSTVVSIISILATFHITRWKFHRSEKKRYELIEQTAKDNYDHLEGTLIKMITALCNCNGLGERFKYELAKLDEAEEIVSQN